MTARYVAPDVDAVAEADLADHEAQTTGVHGIPDTAQLATLADLGSIVSSNVFIGPDPPSSPPSIYLWVQTGLGDGTGVDLLLEDGS